MLTRRQLVATIAGGGAITIAGYSTTPDSNRDAGDSDSGSGGVSREDGDGYTTSVEKLPKTDTFSLNWTRHLSEDELLLIIDVTDADKIDTLTVRNERTQIHTESIDRTGEYRISLDKGYTAPATVTIEARGDGSIVGSIKCHIDGPSSQ
jgi:hypothetical protein